MVVSACASNNNSSSSSGCGSVSIAFAGAQTGSNAQLGLNELYGAQLAVTQHNQQNSGCQVTLKKFDTEGDPSKATGIVTQLASETDVIGVIGLPFSGESKATGSIFEQTGLPHITPSATNVALTTNGWKTFFRGLSPDSVQGTGAAALITNTLHASKAFVIQDDSDFGIGLAQIATQQLGSKVVGTDKVTTGQKDFSATVNKVLAAGPDAVFYAGYYPEAAPLDQQLVNKGFTGKFVGPDGVKDPKFIQLAGSASANTYFTCTCFPGETIPAFAKAYQTATGTAPGTYSAESYDIANIFLKGIDSGIRDRAGLLNFVKSYNGTGLSKHFQWDSTGELTSKAVYGYEVKNGQIVYLGPISTS
jgi:branched-chain amino acid transport system substrate-binding protein